MQRFKVRLFFIWLATCREHLCVLYSRRRFTFSHFVKLQATRQCFLFALVVLLMLLGITIGWKGKNMSGISIFRNDLFQAHMTFTPSPEHVDLHTRVHNTADQISTDYDPSSGRLLISSSAPAHVTATDMSPTENITNTALARNSHVDTGSRLQVPTLSIDAPIETVGAQPDGDMDVPLLHELDGVGWYQKGPWPGQMGSAVIDGYVSRPDNEAAVFSRLGDLHVGDLILIVNQDGSEQHFHVASLQTYLPNNVSLASVFGDKSGAYLNLVTCNGAWTSAAQRSSEPLIVHAIQN